MGLHTFLCRIFMLINVLKFYSLIIIRSDIQQLSRFILCCNLLNLTLIRLTNHCVMLLLFPNKLNRSKNLSNHMILN